MEWINENWIWLVLGGGMVAMHLFGHRGHGGHGAGHGGGCCGGMGSKSKAGNGGDVRNDAPAKQIGVE